MKTVAERFWGKVDKGTGNDSCWVWQGSKTAKGYGVFFLSARRGRPVERIRAHRFAYEALRGPVPDSLQLDHLCRNPVCVNPEHLEVVSRKQNILRGNGACAVHARKTHCIRGHPFNLFNTYISKKGRNCRECRRQRERESRVKGKVP